MAAISAPAAALPPAVAAPTRVRNAVVFVACVAAPFLLQPQLPVRNMDFWLPLASVGLVVGVWFSLHGLSGLKAPGARPALAAIAGVVAALAATRYAPGLAITPGRPPDAVLVAVAIAAAAVAALAAGRLLPQRPRALWVIVGLLVTGLMILKTEALSAAVSGLLRGWGGQAVGESRPGDLSWVGFSYLAFRLMAVLRDRMTNARTLRPYGLGEFVVYALFAPALLSGPIDRADRFLKDWRAPWRLTADDVSEAARRILTGLVKKVAIADTLALAALGPTSAAQVAGIGWTWMALYAYAFRIYFDFGGYTDIAVGVSRLLGARLPENFDRPYLKPNLTQFWNSWHMSLSQWFRGYWFNPLTRTLRIREWSQPAIIAIGQTSTMMLIGLWHGITPNFALWGAWHAAGLFVHNRFSEWAKGRPETGWRDPRWARARAAAGALLTFHFVALGWVWFALPSVDVALRVFGQLAGVGR